VLEVKELTYRNILKGISFSAQQGQVVGVIGKNGAGKSTLLKCLGGFYSYQGRVELLGRELSSYPLSQRVKLVNYLPQSFSIPFDYTVGELLFLSTGKEPSPGVLKEFHLEELLNRRFSELSGGEKVKVFLARLKLISPKVYLLDEPSAFLDPSVLSLLYSFVLKLAEEGSLLFVVSHDLSFLYLISTHFLGLKEGELLFFLKKEEALGRLEELFDCSFEFVRAPGGEVLIKPKLEVRK
jgi:ABC-type multidrug transport system ATPase subunit